MWYYSVKEYYAAQQITLPAAIVDAVFTAVNFGLGYVMIFRLKMGIIGAALAFTICKLLRASEQQIAKPCKTSFGNAEPT